jgi:Rrf2 family protein
MILKQTAEYALRAMIVLAQQEGEQCISAAELSARTNIPASYLSKVMRRLVLASLVRSRRGHGGGFRLARPAAEVSFLEVMQAVDYGAEPNRCAFGVGACNPDSPCPLHDQYTELTETFETWARQTRLSDS